MKYAFIFMSLMLYEYISGMEFQRVKEMGHFLIRLEEEPFFQALKNENFDTAQNILARDPSNRGRLDLFLDYFINKSAIVEFLLKQGANPNSITALHYQLPIFFVEDEKSLQMILSYGADINALGNCEWTPLYHAIVISRLYDGVKKEKWLHKIALLIEKGAHISWGSRNDFDCVFDGINQANGREILKLLNRPFYRLLYDSKNENSFLSKVPTDIFKIIYRYYRSKK